MANITLTPKLVGMLYEEARNVSKFLKFVRLETTDSLAGRILISMGKVTVRAGHTFGSATDKIVDQASIEKTPLEMEELYAIANFDKKLVESTGDYESNLVDIWVRKMGEAIADSIDTYILGLIPGTIYNVLNLANAVVWDGTYGTFDNVVQTLQNKGFNTKAILPTQWRNDVKKWFVTTLAPESGVTVPSEIDTTAIEFGNHLSGTIAPGTVAGAVFDASKLVIYRSTSVSVDTYSPHTESVLAKQNAYMAMASFFLGFGGEAEAFVPLVQGPTTP